MYAELTTSRRRCASDTVIQWHLTAESAKWQAAMAKYEQLSILTLERQNVSVLRKNSVRTMQWTRYLCYKNQSVNTV
jgi:transketolase